MVQKKKRLGKRQQQKGSAAQKKREAVAKVNATMHAAFFNVGGYTKERVALTQSGATKKRNHKGTG